MKYGREEKFIRPCHFLKRVEGENEIRTCPEKTLLIFFSQKVSRKYPKVEKIFLHCSKKEEKKVIFWPQLTINFATAEKKREIRAQIDLF